jgi:Zn-dependent peptidase ImmA (M78 family)
MNDFSATSRSDVSIAAVAVNWREAVGIGIDEWAPDLEKVLFEALPRLIQDFECVVIDDALMPDAAAKTTFGPPRITLTKSIHQRLVNWDEFARLTAAHEIGHLVMHAGQALYRKLDGNKRAPFIEPFRSGERQADRFAQGFLAPQNVVGEFLTAEELRWGCKISPKAAEIAFKEHPNNRKGRKVPDFVTELLEELRSNGNVVPFPRK